MPNGHCPSQFNDDSIIHRLIQTNIDSFKAFFSQNMCFALEENKHFFPALMRMLFTSMKRRCFWCEESGQKEKKRQITLAIGIQFRGKKLFLAISHQYHLHPLHFVQRVLCGVDLPRKMWFVCKIEAFYIPEQKQVKYVRDTFNNKIVPGTEPPC